MKRFVCHILLFLTLLLVAYPVAVCLMGEANCARTGRFVQGCYDHLCRRMQELPQYRDIDILFLGSSHCYRTFDTRFYARQGLRTFNLGSSNQTPIQTEVLLEDYLDSLKPRLVVFEVHGDILGNDGIESTTDLLINAPITRNSTRMAFRTHNAKAMNTWIYGMFCNTILQRFDTFVEDSIIDGFAYVPGGFVETEGKAFVSEQIDPVTLAIRPEQYAALQRCLEMFRQRSIPFLLVEIQDAQQYRQAVTNHRWFESQMERLGSYHYTILPLADSIDFYDNNHLSRTGIAKYNRYLWDEVFKQYLK